MARRSITLEGFGHGPQPIPAASRIGPLLMTGGIHGVDRSTGALPSEAADQIRLMFENLGDILRAGGASLEDVVKVTVFLSSTELRPLINPEWLVAFPDEAARPARHTMINPHLPPGMHVQCDVVAFIQSD